MAADYCLEMSRNLAVNELLILIGSILEERGQHLADFGLPDPIQQSAEVLREIKRWSMFNQSF